MSKGKTLLVSAFVTALMVGVLMASPGISSDSPADASSPGPKVTLCHTPPNNPTNGYGIAAKTISVGERAAQIHLGYGDTLGPC